MCLCLFANFLSVEWGRWGFLQSVTVKQTFVKLFAQQNYLRLRKIKKVIPVDWLFAWKAFYI
jgi:hypothetical protein